jgi:hypothetical protein
MIPIPTVAKNGQERVATKPDNTRHLEYFNNGQWRHNDKCSELQIETVRLRDLIVLLNEVPQSQIINTSYLICTIFV